MFVNAQRQIRIKNVKKSKVAWSNIRIRSSDKKPGSIYARAHRIRPVVNKDSKDETRVETFELEGRVAVHIGPAPRLPVRPFARCTLIERLTVTRIRISYLAVPFAIVRVVRVASTHAAVPTTYTYLLGWERVRTSRPTYYIITRTLMRGGGDWWCTLSVHHSHPSHYCGCAATLETKRYS